MLDQLDARRLQLQKRDVEPWLSDYDAACAYVQDQGVVMPWSTKGYPLPCLRSVFHGTIEREPGPIWGWKDRMPLERKAYYGALLRHGKVLLAPRLAPAFYRASGRTGDSEDYLSDYEEGTLSRLAKQIVDVISNEPCLTSDLRSRLQRLGADTKHLSQDLDVLQARFYVTKIDVVDNARQYGYVWGLVDNCWPDLARESAGRSKSDARAEVARALLDAAVYLRAAELDRMTGWGRPRSEQVLESLSQRGLVDKSEADKVYFVK